MTSFNNLAILKQFLISSPSLKISPGCSWEGLTEAEIPILWPPDVKSWLIWKDPGAGKDWRWEKGTTEDELVEWHHWLNGHGFGWTPGVSDGHGGLVCCSSWGRRVGHNWATETNWTELCYLATYFCSIAYRLMIQNN